jgi:hypothetical protein
MSKKVQKEPMHKSYEEMIFNQLFHLKYNASVLKVIKISKYLNGQGFKSNSNLVYFLYFVDYRRQRLHFFALDIDIFFKSQQDNIRHKTFNSTAAVQYDGLVIPFDVFKNEEQNFEIIGYFKNYVLWPISALIRFIRDFSDSNSIGQVYQRCSKLEKETKDMGWDERHEFIRGIVQELKFYKAL